MTDELSIGIDIGGTNTVLGIVDKQGNCLQTSSIKTISEHGVRPYVEMLAEEIKKLVESVNAEAVVKGVGIGAPNGNYYTGTIEFAPNLDWKESVPLVKLIEKKTALPVVLTNDANAAALGEMLFGSAIGMKDFILISLGTGVGSGIVVNGNLVYGHDGFAGEIGHTVVDPLGRVCGCGKRGCLEMYCSSRGIVYTVIDILKESSEPSILRKYNTCDINSYLIYEAAKENDKIALAAFENTGKILGMKLADAVAHTGPEAIILFGGLSMAGEYILKPTRKYMNIYLLPIWIDKIKLMTSKLNQSNAAVLGAAALAFKEFS